MRKQLIKLFKKRPKMGLTIGGGGCKTFYALGFCEVLLENGWKFSSITATSAGAAMALSILLENIPDIVEQFCHMAEQVKSNFRMEQIFKGNNPFPHEKIYRETLIDNLDADKIYDKKVKLVFNALELPSELSSPEKGIKRSQLVVKLLNAYVKENQSMKKYNYEPLLAKIIEKNHLKEKLFCVDKNTDMAKLVNIVLACSCVPPIVSFQKIGNNKYYLDGGFYDNLPVKNHDEDIELVMAIYYKAVNKEKNIVKGNDRPEKTFYIYPDRVLPVSTWDYSNPDAIREVYHMGRDSGHNLIRFVDFHDKFFLS